MKTTPHLIFTWTAAHEHEARAFVAKLAIVGAFAEPDR